MSSSEEEQFTSLDRVRSHTLSYPTSCDELDEDPGEQRVVDVTIQFFYTPRTLTLLFCFLSLMIYFAFIRDADASQHNNFWHGALGVFGSFMVISLLICPNVLVVFLALAISKEMDPWSRCPFVRPHPALWRLVLGTSIVYALILIFALFQSYNDILTILYFFDPTLKFAKPDTEVYAEDCSLSVLWSRMDVFVVAHFLGWAMKAVMLRHAALLWLLSIMWEITEIAFSHLLENFKECWWDSILLDVLICNGLGIHFGLYICKKLEMREYHWESIKDIVGTSKKLKRAMLQFTPVSWTEVRWFDPKCVKMRYFGLCGLCIIWQISELNTFFLKHIFVIPTGHWINVTRVIIIGLIVIPTLRQFYLYITDTRCKRVGTQCWMFICITFLEFILSVRHAMELFSRTEFLHVAVWLLFVMLVCLLLIYIVVVHGANKNNASLVKRLARRAELTRNVSDICYEGDNEELKEPTVKRRSTRKSTAKIL